MAPEAASPMASNIGAYAEIVSIAIRWSFRRASDDSIGADCVRFA
jgi:hypothetical protein